MYANRSGSWNYEKGQVTQCVRYHMPKVYVLVGFYIYVIVVTFMGMRNLPDMYAQIPRVLVTLWSVFTNPVTYYIILLGKRI